MKTLDQIVDEDIFLRRLDAGPLSGLQKSMLHGFLQTSETPLEFINKAISLRMPQSLISHAEDALAASVRGEKRHASK